MTSRAYDVGVLGRDFGGLCAALLMQRQGFRTALLMQADPNKPRTQLPEPWTPSPALLEASPAWERFSVDTGLDVRKAPSSTPRLIYAVSPERRFSINGNGHVHVDAQRGPKTPLDLPSTLWSELRQTALDTSTQMLNFCDVLARGRPAPKLRQQIADLARRRQHLAAALAATGISGDLELSFHGEKQSGGTEADLTVAHCAGLAAGPRRLRAPIDVWDSCIERFRMLGGEIIRDTITYEHLDAQEGFILGTDGDAGTVSAARLVVSGPVPADLLRIVARPLAERLSANWGAPTVHDYRASLRCRIPESLWPFSPGTCVHLGLGGSAARLDGHWARVRSRAAYPGHVGLHIDWLVSRDSQEAGYTFQRRACLQALRATAYLVPAAEDALQHAAREAFANDAVQRHDGRIAESRFSYPRLPASASLRAQDVRVRDRLVLAGPHLFATLGSDAPIVAAYLRSAPYNAKPAATSDLDKGAGCHKSAHTRTPAHKYQIRDGRGGARSGHAVKRRHTGRYFKFQRVR